jgi:hypothetical protein
MPHAVRRTTLAGSAFGEAGSQLSGRKPPVDRCRGAVAGHVQRESGLAVGDLAGGAGVLPGHAGRGVSVLEEAGVIDDQRGGFDHLLHPPGEAGAHMRRVPRAGGDEAGQGLPVAVLVQPGGHRLHRLAPPVQ